eukprot:jgi/Ulvmu1/5615/UM023_0153.1
MSGSVARILTLVGAGGATVAAFTLTDFKFKCYSAALPAVRIFDAETAHRLTIGAAKYGLLPSDNRKDDARLRVHLWGRTFSNPLGIAAGFDKDAEAIEPVLNMGLGFMEVGSIPPRPQPGNPAPRCFRIPEHNAIVNRMGFNSQGIQGALPRLQTYHTRRQDGEADQSKVLFINLGKNKETKDGAADFVEGVEKLLPFADAIVVNVSSPNTPGLRSLQGRKELTDIVRRVRAAMDTGSQPHAPLPVAAPAHPHPPLLIKIAPDLSDADRADIAAVATAKSPAVDGLVISNTTVSRPPSVRGAAAAAEAGGLSGAPVMAASTEVLADMYRRTNGAVPLVGCGGVMSGGDAYAKIRAGASLVELYTALVYKGPALIPDIKRELLRCLEADGFSSVEEAVGADHR